MIVKSEIHSFILCFLDSSPTLVPVKSLLSFSRPHLLSRVLALFPSCLLAPPKRRIFAQLHRIYKKRDQVSPRWREKRAREQTRGRGDEVTSSGLGRTAAWGASRLLRRCQPEQMVPLFPSEVKAGGRGRGQPGPFPQPFVSPTCWGGGAGGGVQKG